MTGANSPARLLADAYRLLVPYVNACPTCTDDLLKAIAAQVTEEVRKTGMTSIVLWDTKPSLDKSTAVAAHLRVASARTAELLVGVPRHEHRPSS